jgi:hypothetical protein
MILSVCVALDSTHCPTIIVWVEDEVAAYDLLTGWAKEGLGLNRVTLVVDEGNRLDLPVALFEEASSWLEAGLMKL